MKKQSVFVSGIAGLLGSHLADAFIEAGHEVSGCDNLIGGDIENVPKEATFYEVDCGGVSMMTHLLKDIDVVYHCACTAYEGLSVFSPNMICQNTYQNSISMISASIASGVKRFVYCSSMARYGKQQTPFTEDMLPKPVDPYGIAKYAVEMTLESLCKTHGMEYVIAVPHNIIGARQKYDDPFRNVASIMINLMLQGRRPIIYGDGKQVRCFSFIGDCVESLKKMATLDISGGIINIGPDKEYITINKLYKTIAKLLDFKGEPVYVPDRPCEVKKAICSASQARFVLGYKEQTSLEDGLKDMIEYIKEKGVKLFEYHIDLEIENELTPKTWTNKLF